MAINIGTVRWILAWAFVAGVIMGIFGLFAFDGLPSVSAQTDTTAPTISSVAITSDTGDGDSILDDDGVYGIGDSIEVTVTFNETVTVTGAPQLELDIDGTAETAEYDSTVVFTYTVAEGDSDDDGIAISANKLTLNGGAIKDAADNAANLSHEALSVQTGHQVDGIRPTISAVSFVFSKSVGADGTYPAYTEGEQLSSSAKFSEEVIVTGTPQMGLDFEGVTKTADFAQAIPKCGDDWGCAYDESPWPVRRGISLRFYYRVLATDSDSDGVAISANAVSLNGGAIKDTAGNDAVLTHDAVAEDANFTVSPTAIGGL